MIYTREILEKYTPRYPDFGYYDTIISKIENNLYDNPDITIEACQSLIEGVAKSVLLYLDKTQQHRIIEKGKFMPSYDKAITLLSREYERILTDESDFEINICKEFRAQIVAIREIRNSRSDISHGRSVPKKFNSSIKLSKTIKGITDNITTYILEHLFILLDALPTINIIEYDSEEYKEFNIFLDLQFDAFPIEKVGYSKVLYDYEPETYIVKYKDYTSSLVVEDNDNTYELIVEYNSFDFWNSERITMLKEFCKIHKLNQSKVIAIFDKYWDHFDDIENMEIVDAMFTPPDIEKRRDVFIEYLKYIKQLAEDLNTLNNNDL